MIQFQVEPWSAIADEVAPLWKRHWLEVGEDRDRIALDPDLDGYARLAEAGRLHIVAGRRDGVLVAYSFSIVSPHLHYKSTLFAASDIYWVEPLCRGGRTAVRLFTEVERTLKDRGVVKIVQNTKLAHDQGRIFRHLGYREAERIYVKVI